MCSRLSDIRYEVSSHALLLLLLLLLTMMIM